MKSEPIIINNFQFWIENYTLNSKPFNNQIYNDSANEAIWYFIKKHLKEIIKEENIEKWLNTPNNAFDNEKPINVDPNEILKVIYFLESGVPI